MNTADFNYLLVFKFIKGETKKTSLFVLIVRNLINPNLVFKPLVC